MRSDFEIRADGFKALADLLDEVEAARFVSGCFLVCREFLIYAAFGILNCPLQCEFQEKSVMLSVVGFTPEALSEGNSPFIPR